MLRSPRERFIASTYSGKWGQMTQTEVYEEAIHAALGELNDQLPMHTANPQESLDSYQQLVGARKFMGILSTLHTPQTTPKQTQAKGLDYSAGV